MSHNKQTYYKKLRANSLAVLLLVLLTSSLAAWTIYDTVPTGNYIFSYPANFGNRINVPADNPTTQQGVYLGRLLFYDVRLSANNQISCGSCLAPFAAIHGGP